MCSFDVAVVAARPHPGAILRSASFTLSPLQLAREHHNHDRQKYLAVHLSVEELLELLHLSFPMPKMARSAPLFANELLRGTAEIAGAGIGWHPGSVARGYDGAGRAGILAVHRLRVAIDLTCEACCIHGWHPERHRRRDLPGLSKSLSSESCTSQ